MSQGVHLRKYGVQTTIDFELYEVDGVDLRTDWTPAAADCEVMKDEGSSTQCSNTATDEGETYSIVLTATEMQAARLVLKVVDAATKVFLDKIIIIETYGNASGQHAIDLDDGVRAGLTALPNAAADAAGGLPISDAGGLDLDTQLAETDEITAARMGALTDWINGGRLDLLLDAVLADTGELQTDDVPGLIAALNDPTVGAIADAVWDEVLTGASHNDPTSAGRRLRTLQDFGVYEGGAVWVDTVNGTAGTTDYENGTVNNPVDSIADAKTIADSVGLVVFHVLPGSSVTLAAAYDGYEFKGYGYTVVLNGQSVSGTLFEHAIISGNDDGSNALPTAYRGCAMGSNTLGEHVLIACRLTGDIVLAEAADYFWDQCYSGVAGTGTPSVDLQSAAEAKNLSIRHYSGGIEVKNFGAGSGTHTASLEGVGQLVINANCAGGTIAIRGNFTVTDNASAAVTLSDDARIDIAQIGDAAWEETLADHLGAGTTGNALNAAGAAGDPWATAIPGAYGAGTAGKILGDNINAPLDTIDTVVDAIKAVTDNLPDSGALNDLATILADTGELQTDWANGGRLDLLLDAIKAVTDNLPDSGALDDLAAILTDTGTTLPATLATILGDTNELQADWVNGGRLDLLLDAIKAVTDALPDSGALTTIGTDTARLTAARAGALTDWVNGGRLDLLLDAIKAVTDALPDSGALTTIGTDTARLTAVRAAVLTDLIDGGRLDIILDAIKVETDKLGDAHAEPTGVPAANETPLDKIGYLFMALRNKITVSATKKTFYGDDDAAEFEKDLSDDGTYTETEANAI